MVFTSGTEKPRLHVSGITFRSAWNRFVDSREAFTFVKTLFTKCMVSAGSVAWNSSMRPSISEMSWS